MKVSITSTIEASAEEAWNLVKQSNTLLYITRGLMGFKPIESELPKEWLEGNTEQLRIMLFGVIPAWRHQISFKKISDKNMDMLTHESGGVVNTWNHLINVKPLDASSCTYTDDVEIKAGLFTPFIWLYAHVFYRYRQLRWRSWVKKSAK
jgi:hypothetical protein